MAILAVLLAAQAVLPARGGGQPVWRPRMDLLGRGDFEEIRFLVDVQYGRDPKWEALDRLTAIASKYARRPARWERIEQGQTSWFVWDPFDQLHCTAPPPRQRTLFVLVRYAGRRGDAYGWVAKLSRDGPCSGVWPEAIWIAQERIARRAFLWITRRRLEERTLLHEYGHLMGLATNREHAVCLDDDCTGGHCVKAHCLMAPPSFGVVLREAFLTLFGARWPHDYCRRCRRDIESAQRALPARARSPDSPPPPAPHTGH